MITMSTDHWFNQFNVKQYEGKKPNLMNKIILETPVIDYYFTREQWKKFKGMVNVSIVLCYQWHLIYLLMNAAANKKTKQ